MNLPYQIKEKIRTCSNYYAKANTLNAYLIDYFDKNNIYNEIKDEYLDLVVNSNNSNAFIEILDKINHNNTKYITYKNETHSLKEWCKILNLNYHTVLSRYIRYPDDLDYVFSSCNHTKRLKK